MVSVACSPEPHRRLRHECSYVIQQILPSVAFQDVSQISSEILASPNLLLLKLTEVTMREKGQMEVERVTTCHK